MASGAWPGFGEGAAIAGSHARQETHSSRTVRPIRPRGRERKSLSPLPHPHREARS